MDQQENQEAPESLDEVIGELSAVLGLDAAAARLAAARMLSGALEVLRSMSDSPESMIPKELRGVNEKVGQKTFFGYDADMATATKRPPGRPRTKERIFRGKLSSSAWRFLRRKKKEGWTFTAVIEEALAEAAKQEEEP